MTSMAVLASAATDDGMKPTLYKVGLDPSPSIVGIGRITNLFSVLS